jgi:hypothetical protein
VQTSGVNVREVGSKTSIDLIWFAGEKKHKRWNYNGGTDNTKKFPK